MNTRCTEAASTLRDRRTGICEVYSFHPRRQLHQSHPLRLDRPEPPAPPSPPGPAHYRQEVSLYAAIEPMAAIYGRGHRDGDPLGIYGLGAGPEFEYRFGALQTGMDVYRKERDNGVIDHAGLYVAFGHGEVDVTHNLLDLKIKGGTDSFDALTLGGYWTRFGDKDWYLDGVVQGTFYDVTTQSRRGLLTEFPDQDISGFGLAASLEGGYPFDLGDGWQIEPQAQLIYQAIDFDDFHDGAAEVRFGGLDSLTGRIGARLARTWAVEEEQASEPDASSGAASKPARLATVWGRVNLWHEFEGSSTTEFSSATGFIPFSAELEETWVELGLGGSLQLNPTTTLYGNVNYETTFDGDSYGFDGKIGVRMNW